MRKRMYPVVFGVAGLLLSSSVYASDQCVMAERPVALTPPIPALRAVTALAGNSVPPSDRSDRMGAQAVNAPGGVAGAKAQSVAANSIGPQGGLEATSRKEVAAADTDGGSPALQQQKMLRQPAGPRRQAAIEPAAPVGSKPMGGRPGALTRHVLAHNARVADRPSAAVAMAYDQTSTHRISGALGRLVNRYALIVSAGAAPEPMPAFAAHTRAVSVADPEAVLSNDPAISARGSESAISARGSYSAISARGSESAISARGSESAISARGSESAISARGSESAPGQLVQTVSDPADITAVIAPPSRLAQIYSPPGRPLSRIPTLRPHLRPLEGVTTARANISLPSLRPYHPPPGPRPHPPIMSAEPAEEQSKLTSADYATIQQVLERYKARDANGLRLLAKSAAHPLAKMLGRGLWVRLPESDLDLRGLLQFRRDHPDWPETDMVRRRIDQALHNRPQSAAHVLKIYNEVPPGTTLGELNLAKALRDIGRTSQARSLARHIAGSASTRPWVERKLIRTFAKDLGRDILLDRLERALMDRNWASAKILASHLNVQIRRVISVLRVGNNARLFKKRYARLGAKARRRASVVYARVDQLRRSDKHQAAARILVNHPSAQQNIGSEKAWWEIRRIVSEKLLAAGKAKRAYQVVAGHGLTTGWRYREAEMLAGRIALRHLSRPHDAIKHFMNFANAGVRGDSIATGRYWAGQAAEAAGIDGLAQMHYRRAAEHPTSYYGQLALHETGAKELVLPCIPLPSPVEKARFEEEPLVQLVHILSDLDAYKLAGELLVAASSREQDTTHLSMLLRLAEEIRQPHMANRVGRSAERKGVFLHGAAFILSGLPALAFDGAKVEPAVLFGVARQESGFNHTAMSRAGARGLMQLMPATAREVARDLGLAFGRERLHDPDYNLTLGRAYLAKQIRHFSGSYIMAFAAYNAGASRVYRWKKIFGDPRHPNVNPVDWVEQIPFRETRGYVKKLLANIQTYRAILGGGRAPLQVWDDLTRGRNKGRPSG